MQGLQSILDDKIDQTKANIENRKESIINECGAIFQELQDQMYLQGARDLGQLADRPLSDENSKLALLFSMVQMVTKEERNSEPVKRLIGEVSQEVSPSVDAFNEQVKKYHEIIKQQRICSEQLKWSPNIKGKAYKYEEMVRFDDIASKNLVGFYYDYNKLPDTLRALKEDIKSEERSLGLLETEIARRQLSEEQRRAEERRLAEARRQQEERNRRQHRIDLVRNKITTALDILRGRVNELDHPLTQAKDVANILLARLEEAQSTYLLNLEHALESLDSRFDDFAHDPRVNEINIAYIQACEGLIKDQVTRRVLERDLHWGPFLNNLLKIIVNAVISVVTFGQVNGFFKLERSKTIVAVDEAEPSLIPAIG